jgi:hypothetical protein
MAQTHVKFYNVSKEVGPGKPNVSDDVLLVQFFLSEIGDFWQILSGKPNSMGTSPLIDLKILKPLPVNGKADQNLYNWIKWFQSVSSFGGTSAALDGIVSPAPSALYKGSHSKVVFSIVKMNNAFQSFFRSRWDNLPTDPKVPSQLRTALENNRV